LLAEDTLRQAKMREEAERRAAVAAAAVEAAAREQASAAVLAAELAAQEELRKVCAAAGLLLLAPMLFARLLPWGLHLADWPAAIVGCVDSTPRSLHCGRPLYVLPSRCMTAPTAYTIEFRV
jgi:hypothetical protein